MMAIEMSCMNVLSVLFISLGFCGTCLVPLISFIAVLLPWPELGTNRTICGRYSIGTSHACMPGM